MKVVVIGTGYVGLVSGACIADLGTEVVCIDKDASKIATLLSGGIPIFEPGLKEVVARNRSNGRLAFTRDLSDALKGADAVMLAVGTPTLEHDRTVDMSYVFAAAEEVAMAAEDNLVVITKSTVPVGTGAQITQRLKDKRPDLTFHVASNPEFLREGSAIDDFMHPDRIIVGADSDHGKNVLQTIYRPLLGEGVPVLFTNIASAELIKYASNAFLAMKIAFANEVSDICEGVGADMAHVLKGMSLDERIGIKHMNPGPGFGGSCFPKDTMALTGIAEQAGFPTRIIETVISVNDQRKERMAQKIIDAANGDVRDKTITILGLAFKANTDDVRYSSALVIVERLVEAGANVKAYDPEAMEEAQRALTVEKASQIIWSDSIEHAVEGADMTVILTEWDVFKELDPAWLSQTMRGNIVVDLRNVLLHVDMESHGLIYVCLGRQIPEVV